MLKEAWSPFPEHNLNCACNELSKKSQQICDKYEYFFRQSGMLSLQVAFYVTGEIMSTFFFHVTWLEAVKLGQSWTVRNSGEADAHAQYKQLPEEIQMKRSHTKIIIINK